MGLFDEGDGGMVTYWKSISAITDEVGAGSSARIYPEQARQKKASGSYIVYMRQGGESFQHSVGVSGTRTTDLHVFCYADTMALADTLMEAVRSNTANKRGTLSGTLVNFIVVTDAPDSGINKAEDGSDDHEYWVRVILQITHEESVGV